MDPLVERRSSRVLVNLTHWAGPEEIHRLWGFDLPPDHESADVEGHAEARHTGRAAFGQFTIVVAAEGDWIEYRMLNDPPAAQHAHAARPPLAREIVAILVYSDAARLRRRLMRRPLSEKPVHADLFWHLRGI